MGDALQQCEQIGVEGPRPRGHHRQHAPHVIVDEDRQRQLGVKFTGLDGAAEQRVADALGAREVGDHEAPGLRGLAGVRVAHAPLAQPLGLLRRQPTAGEQDEVLVRGVQPIHHAHVRAGHAQDHVERLLGGGDQVAARAHRDRGGVERLQLAVAPLDVGNRPCGRRKSRRRAHGDDRGAPARVRRSWRSAQTSPPARPTAIHARGRPAARGRAPTPCRRRSVPPGGPASARRRPRGDRSA